MFRVHYPYIEEVKLKSYKVLDDTGKVVVSVEDANVTGVVKDDTVEMNCRFQKSCCPRIRSIL